MKRRLKVLAAATAAFALPTAVAVADSSPSVLTGGVSRVSQTAAELHGTVNPNGSATTYLFQWGLTTSYGASGTAQSAGSGTRSVAVAQAAGGLIPGTTYHYRLVATNRYGTSAGADRTFTTAGHPPPDVATGPATGVTSSGAVLTGVVNPHGQDTTWTFQYGTSTAYTVSTIGGSVGASGSPVSVASQLQGLAAGTVFHYRLVATHGANATTYGADGQFMTLPARRPIPRVRAGTSPRRARRRPFVFTTRGSVTHPGWIPAAYACTGDVAIRFLRGRRQVAQTLVPLQPSCAFSGRTVFRRLPGRGRRRRAVTLTVRVRFTGNGYLAPRRGRAQTVVLG